MEDRDRLAENPAVICVNPVHLRLNSIAKSDGVPFFLSDPLPGIYFHRAMIRSMESDEFYKNYQADVRSAAGCDWDSFSQRISCVQAALLRELREVGLEEFEHFEIGWDLDERYFVCGSVQGLEAITADFVPAVLRAFSEDEEPAAWVCHFAVEAARRVSLEFYIQGNGDITICEEPGWEGLRDRFEIAR